MRCKIGELKKLLTAARNEQYEYSQSLKGETNPQLVVMRLKAEARAEAYEDCLLAVNGDMVNLKISAKH